MEQQAPTHREKSRIYPRIYSGAMGLACVAILVATIGVVVYQSRVWGGVDNYLYILYANDLVEDPAATSWARYFYFPGTYSFWRVIATFAGHDIAAYQRGFLGICLANAAFIALIVRSVGCNALIAAASFWAYLSWTTRLGIQSMTTEEICTAPVLLGILLWLAFSRREKSMAGLVSLGVGYGLAVFVKQQGAFVAMGAIGLFVASAKRPFDGRVFRDLGIVTIIALLTFTCALSIEGGGLQALQDGVAAGRNYQAFGDLWHNLAALARRFAELTAVFGVALLAGIVALFLSARNTIPMPPATTRIWALSATTALVPLYQYSRRGYDHYVLLSLPFVIITVCLAATWIHEKLLVPFGKSIGDRLARASRREEIVQHGAVFLGRALQFAFLCALTLHVGFDLRSAYATTPRGPPHLAYVDQCRDIEPGKRLLLLPSRLNALHWACKTHARGTQWGYSFNFQEKPQDYIAEIQKPDLEQVFVFDPKAGSYEQQTRTRSNWSPFFAELAQRGFVKVRTSHLGTLYKRSRP